MVHPHPRQRPLPPGRRRRRGRGVPVSFPRVQDSSAPSPWRNGHSPWPRPYCCSRVRIRARHPLFRVLPGGLGCPPRLPLCMTAVPARISQQPQVCSFMDGLLRHSRCLRSGGSPLHSRRHPHLRLGGGGGTPCALALQHLRDMARGAASCWAAPALRVRMIESPCAARAACSCRRTPRRTTGGAAA